MTFIDPWAALEPPPLRESIKALEDKINTIEGSGLEGEIDAIEAAEWVTAARIATNAVEAAKIKAGAVENTKLNANAKELFPQLLSAGSHVEATGSVEVEKETTVEQAHGLTGSPTAFSLDFTTSETPTGPGIWLTEAPGAEKLKIHNGLNKKVKVYWTART